MPQPNLEQPTSVATELSSRPHRKESQSQTEDRPTTTRPTTVISVLLVDDHALMREGLRQLFSLEEDLQVVGEAVDGLDALQKIRELSPDVVLMDISMPVIDGITLTRQITQEFPSVAVIMLTMYQQQQ